MIQKSRKATELVPLVSTDSDDFTNNTEPSEEAKRVFGSYLRAAKNQPVVTLDSLQVAQ